MEYNMQFRLFIHTTLPKLLKSQLEVVQNIAYQTISGHP